MKKFLPFLPAIGAVAVSFWFEAVAAEPAEETKPPVARVQTAVLKRQMISQMIQAFGVVAAAPSGDQVIVAASDCLIGKILVAPGMRVAAGETLFEINPTPDAKLQLDSARSAFALAHQALQATQERYDLKLANRTELLTAQQADQDTRLKIDSFERRGLGTDGKITAPAAGVVSKLELSTGALVNTGTALITITTEARLDVRLGVEVGEAVQIRAGQSVTLFSANRTDAQPVASAVRVAGNTLDAATGTVDVRVPVPGGAPLLLGEHVKALIEADKKETLVAPRSAVLPDNDKWVLYTVKTGHAVRHEVTVGISAGDLLEVSGADLHDGDTIVTLGNYELADGMAVQSQEAETAAPAKQPDGKAAGAKEARP